MSNRNGFVGNHNNYPWHHGHGQGQPDWYGFGNPAVFMNQGHFPQGPPQGAPFQNRYALLYDFAIEIIIMVLVLKFEQCAIFQIDIYIICYMIEDYQKPGVTHTSLGIH